MPAPLVQFIVLSIGFVSQILMVIIILSVLATWLDANQSNPIVRMIHDITEPIYSKVRILTGRIPGPLDWAPLLIIFILIAAQRILIPVIQSLATH